MINKYITTLLIFLFVSVQTFAQDIIMGEFVAQTSREQIEKERKDSIDKINKDWSVFFSEINGELDELYQKLNSIDSDTTAKVKDYKSELNFIEKLFAKKEKKGEWIDNKSIDKQYKEYIIKCDKINNKITELQTPPAEKEKTNWLLILGIAAGVLVMGGLPIIMQISTKYSARKQQKDIEWQGMNEQYMQIPQNFDENYIPHIQTLILRYENFLEKKPKKMYKKNALAKIKELKLKQLKIGKKINI